MAKTMTARGFHRLVVTGTLVVLTAGALASLVPLLWTLSSSLKNTIQVFAYPPVWLPRPMLWGNYLRALQSLPFPLFFRNSVVVSALSVTGTVLSASIVAFGFARLRAPGSRLLFAMVIGSMLLPGQVTMIPTYILFKELHWLNTFKALVVPHFLGGGAFSIFLLRQFFMTLPNELDDAAKLDGANVYRTFWNVILPLSKPALATVVIFAFINSWTDFFGPLIYLSDMKRFTAALGLAVMAASGAGSGMYAVPWELVMAGSVMLTLPILGVFFVGQQYFVQGIALTGIKG
ncbi:MAG: carbohydrate ABC transporter permease [Anaerolineae bacterium]